MVQRDIVKATFNLDTESIDKTCSIIRNEARALAKKKLLTP